MKKVVIVIAMLMCLIPYGVDARRGCCSHHGGVAGCSGGRQLCNDGTLSPTCTCSSGTSSSATVSKPTYNYGCTDSSAINYDAKANKDNGSCIAKKYGCMDKAAINYDSSANVSNYDCQYKKVLVITEKIKIDTEYKENDEMLEGKSKVVTIGKDGEKEVTYDAVVDSDGNVISKVMTNEKIINLPINRVVEKGTKEANPFWGVLWIIALIVNFYHVSKYKNGHLILNWIGFQKNMLKLILYVFYVVFIIPVLIDSIIIIIDWFKYLSLKKNLQ